MLGVDSIPETWGDVLESTPLAQCVPRFVRSSVSTYGDDGGWRRYLPLWSRYMRGHSSLEITSRASSLVCNNPIMVVAVVVATPQITTSRVFVKEHDRTMSPTA